jgi:acetylglutamate kinase
VDQSTDAKVRNAAKSFSTEMNPLVEKQENAVRNGVPAAHVLTLAGANHYIFLSNEDEVVRDIRDFVARVP